MVKFRSRSTEEAVTFFPLPAECYDCNGWREIAAQDTKVLLLLLLLSVRPRIFFSFYFSFLLFFSIPVFRKLASLGRDSRHFSRLPPPSSCISWFSHFALFFRSWFSCQDFSPNRRLPGAKFFRELMLRRKISRRHVFMLRLLWRQRLSLAKFAFDAMELSGLILTCDNNILLLSNQFQDLVDQLVTRMLFRDRQARRVDRQTNRQTRLRVLLAALMTSFSSSLYFPWAGKNNSRNISKSIKSLQISVQDPVNPQIVCGVFTTYSVTLRSAGLSLGSATLTSAVLTGERTACFMRVPMWA